MDAIVNGCSIEQDGPVLDEYGDDVLYAEWNPQLPLASLGPVAQLNRHVDLPADLAGVDVDAFLKKMYAYQR